MSKSAKEFEEFARDCVRLAEQADTPALREKLLGLAREWMQAVMDVEDAEAKTGKSPGLQTKAVDWGVVGPLPHRRPVEDVP
jgi:hypothetical protein